MSAVRFGGGDLTQTAPAPAGAGPGAVLGREASPARRLEPPEDFRARAPGSAPPPVPRAQEAASGLGYLPIEQLRSSYARLRPGVRRIPWDGLKDLPLRVAPAHEPGAYEVLDGFKRLARWREQGRRLVPVVVETALSASEHKRLLLSANAPARTTTALDEARVVCSLVDEDHHTPGQVARILGRRPAWVDRRLALGLRLSPEAQVRLASGRIGPTLAHALTAMKGPEQSACLAVIDRDGLTASESLRFVEAYHVADEADRKQLLRSPLEREAQGPDPPGSPRARELEADLRRFQATLHEFSAFALPDELAPAERRRLDALFQVVLAELHEVARQLCPPPVPPPPEEDSHATQRSDTLPLASPPARAQAARNSPRDARGNHQARSVLRVPPDRRPRPGEPQDRPTGAARGGPAASSLERVVSGGQARAVPRPR